MTKYKNIEEIKRVDYWAVDYERFDEMFRIFKTRKSAIEYANLLRKLIINCDKNNFAKPKEKWDKEDRIDFPIEHRRINGASYTYIRMYKLLNK